MINCSATLICKAPNSANITPLHNYNLHWLPISSRIQCKIALTRFHIVSGIALPYLSELLHLYSPCSLCSALDTQIFHVPRMGRSILSIHWTCDLELSSSVYQAFFFTFLDCTTAGLILIVILIHNVASMMLFLWGCKHRRHQRNCGVRQVVMTVFCVSTSSPSNLYL